MLTCAIPEIASSPEEVEVPHPWDKPTAVVLTIVHLGAVASPFFFSRSGLLLAVVLYTVACLGITLGYHRLLTHRSFRCRRWVEVALVGMAALACQGGPSTWVAVHRLHHARSDKPGDPHGSHRGFWYSHMGWMLSRPPHKLDPALKARFAPDVERDPVLRFMDRMHFVFAALTAITLYSLGGWSWLFWGGFVRMTATYHATWLVNSASHLYGYRSHSTQDRSTNNWWVALITFGEGWHNNHHAFPSSARQGLSWWEVDISWLILQGLTRLGLVWDCKLPPRRA
jgi:fatty-acid desaturase